MAAKPKEEKPKEWWEELAFADPRERDMILASQGYTPTGGFQGWGDEEEAEPLTIDDYAAAYLGGGLPPQFGLEGVGALPQYTTKGALDPRDMTQVGQGINVAQDYGALFVDNALTSMYGPGAYSAEAFTPELEYGDEVVLKGQNRLVDLSQKGGWEGYVAKQMLPPELGGRGMSGTEAMAALEQFVTAGDPNDPDLSDTARAYYTSVVASLPGLTKKPETREVGQKTWNPETQKWELDTDRPPEDLGFWADYDYDKIYGRVQELGDALYEDDPWGWQDPATGKYYDRPPTEIKTPPMEWYDKYGLPYPTESYADPKYINQILNREEGTTPEMREAETQEFLRGYEDLDRKVGEAHRNIGDQERMDREMQAAWEALLPQAGTPRAPTSTSRPLTTTIPGSPNRDAYDYTIPGVNVPLDTSQPLRITTPERYQRVPTGGPMGSYEKTPARDITIPGVNIPTTTSQPLTTTVPARSGWAPRDITIPGVNIHTPTAQPGLGREPHGQLPGLFQGQPPQTEPNMPLVRTLPNGLVGLVGRQQPGMWGVLGGPLGDAIKGTPDERFRPETSERQFAGFGGRIRRPADKPEGTTRPIQAEDAGYRGREQRRKETKAAYNAALHERAARKRADPRRNDIEQGAYLWMLAQLGRTPLGDVQQQRLTGIRGLGL